MVLLQGQIIGNMCRIKEEVVNKGYHCAWQIHYHVVFPVKHRKALLDKDVVKIIIDTAKGISKLYDIDL